MDMFERPAGTSGGPDMDLAFMSDVSRAMDIFDTDRPHENGRAEEPEEEAKEGGAATPEPIYDETPALDPATTTAGVLEQAQFTSDGNQTYGSSAEVPATDNPGLRETRPMIEPTQNGSGSTDENS